MKKITWLPYWGSLRRPGAPYSAAQKVAHVCALELANEAVKKAKKHGQEYSVVTDSIMRDVPRFSPTLVRDPMKTKLDWAASFQFDRGGLCSYIT